MSTRRLAHMPDMTISYLRCCAGCSGFFAAHNSKSFDGAYFCDKCMPKVMPDDFNPQPNDVVRFIDGPRVDWVVVSRDGDMVSIRRLGFPESEPRSVSIHALYPRCPYRPLPHR